MTQPLNILLLFTVCAAIAIPANTPQQHPHLMMVVSKGLPGISIYDANSDTVLCHAVVGVSPHEAAFSLDGRMAYVPVYGTASVGTQGTDEHTLQFIRTSDCKITGTLDTGENKRPHGIAVGASGTIYLTSEVSKSLLLINPAKQEIIGKIPTDSQYSHMIAVMPDEKKIFVSNVQSKTVSVLDVPGRRLAEVIPTGVENQRMTLTPDDQFFVTNLGPDHKIGFYRTSDYKLAFSIPIDGTPFVSRFSTDGKFLYNAGMKDGHLHAWKIDYVQRKVVATSEPVGSALGSIAVNPFTNAVYVTDPPSSQMVVLDPKTWKVTKKFSTEKTPDAILFKTVQ